MKTTTSLASIAVRRFGRIRYQRFYFEPHGLRPYSHPFNFSGSPVLYGWIRSKSNDPCVINGRVFGFCHVAEARFIPLGTPEVGTLQLHGTPSGRETGTPSIDVRAMDSCGIAYLILSYRVSSDVSASSFHGRKPIETDATMAGLNVRYNGFGEALRGFVGTLTGRYCFAYAGRGNAWEAIAADGWTAWVTDFAFGDGEPTKLEARREALHAETDARRICSVRKPTSVRIVDREYDDISCRREPTIVMCTDYTDHRQRQHAAATRRRMINLRRDLATYWREYRAAVRRPAQPGDGGRAHYAPFYVEFGRNGYDVLGDPSRYAVRAFGPV